jgi:hypothetical protein
MNPAIKALASVGVSIKDMGGNVKPVSAILGDLAGKWKQLSKDQQQNVGVQIAGRYQLTRLLALLNNYSLAVDATTTSMNSQGSSMKEQAKYSDSLQARINRLDTAWSKFTLSMGKAFLTNAIIDAVETFNSLATGASNVVDKIGALSIVFGILGTATVGLNSKFRTFATSMIFGTQGMTRTQLASAGLTAGMSRLEIATGGVKNALRALGTATLVTAAFAVLGIVIEKVINAFGDAKKQKKNSKLHNKKVLLL